MVEKEFGSRKFNHLYRMKSFFERIRQTIVFSKIYPKIYKCFLNLNVISLSGIDGIFFMVVILHLGLDLCLSCLWYERMTDKKGFKTDGSNTEAIQSSTQVSRSRFLRWVSENEDSLEYPFEVK